MNADDILTWWREHRERLPLLASIACMILPLQASSAASERIFSVGNRAKTKNRFNLSSRRLEDLCLININSHTIDNYLEGKTVPKLKMPSDGQIVVDLPVRLELDEESSDEELSEEEYGGEEVEVGEEEI